MTKKRHFCRLGAGRDVALYGILALFLLLAGATAAMAELEVIPVEEGTTYTVEQELEEIVDLHEPAYAETTGEQTTGGSTSVTTGGSSPVSGKAASGYPTGGGSAPTRLVRIAPNAYWDGISELAGQNRLGPREISNIVLSQAGPVFSPKNASDMTWQWGQFVDHDIGITEGHEPPEAEDIPVPLGDPFLDPLGEGGKVIPFNRSIYDPTTGTSTSNPREQLNVISAFIDGTNIYGQNPARTLELRLKDASGNPTAYLNTSPGNFLPYNVNGFKNAQPEHLPPEMFFLAGDIRANEQVALAAMHTLWVREHNRTVDYVRTRHHNLTEEEIFNTAREIVVGELQVITYKEFLPILLGANAIPTYPGSFNPNTDPGLVNVFSTAMYRLGHTMLSGTILRLDPSGNPIPQGNLLLRDAFFTPDTLINEGGLEPIMKGLSSQVMQRIDSLIVDDIRSFLFREAPGATGLDLGSLNIQRGRDHGLPDYNTYRLAYNLAPVGSFDEINPDPAVWQRLEAAYGNVNDIDVWVGALAEAPLGGDILVGELLYTALVDQFTRLRDGDPNWWELVLSPPSHNLVKKQTLAKVILRNTTLLPSQLQANVFIAP